MATKKDEPMPDNLTLGEKLKLKVNEVLDSEKDLDPIAAERVSQIVNDAVTSMPLANTEVAEKPELAMVAKTKAQLEASVNAGTIPKELAAKIEGLLGDVEAAYKAGPVPVQPVDPGNTAPVENVEHTPRPKSRS